MRHWWNRFWLWWHYWKARRTFRTGDFRAWDYHTGRETHHLDALEDVK